MSTDFRTTYLINCCLLAVIIVVTASRVSVVQIAGQASAVFAFAMSALAVANTSAGLRPTARQPFGRMATDVCAHHRHMAIRLGRQMPH